MPHLRGELADFRFEVCGVREQRFGVEHLRHTLEQDAVYAPHGCFSVMSVQAGLIGMADRHNQGAAGPGQLLLVPPEPANRAWRSGISTGIVRLQPDALAHVAQEFFGLPDGRLHAGLCGPHSPAHARHWTATVDHVVRAVLTNPAVVDAPLVRTQAVHLLAAALLTDFPHSGLDAQTEVPVGAAAAPAVVRRAVAFIDTHAHEDITLTDIATAARVGPRALQLAFRRHLDRTPTAVLRQTRLAGAHADLQRADPAAGDTVAGIAGRWGFAGLSAFGAAYRRQYRETPSHTLRGWP
ncbi:MAG TPA: helix-turn-helix transcriptional regulator [Blastococcus sp.]|nr:helix-turn-helix transcriptional regulator [Blastococcus sp.]